MKSIRLSVIGVIVTVFLVAIAAFGTSWAATITVNTAADNRRPHNGKCTLREAIANVNAVADTTGADCAAGTGAGDTITFDLPQPAILRVRRELLVTHDVTITGPGSTMLAIGGRRATRVFHIAAGSTSMSGLTIQKGRTRSPQRARGGGILVESGAALDLTNCILSGNSATSITDAAGGGMAIAGTATLTNCTLRGNSAVGFGFFGVAHGGGMEVTGTVTLTGCTLVENSASSKALTGGSDGGGMVIAASGTAILTNCTLSGNSARAGGGISVAGDATLIGCTLSSNSANGSIWGSPGGGMEVAATGVATLRNCTLSGNSADIAGGIDNSGSATITNCTISGNYITWDDHGGGMENHGTATLTNTIVANNRYSFRGVNCVDFPSLTDGGHNLSSDGTCSTSTGTDLLNTNPLLAPLDNYGGSTQTAALCTAPGVPDLSCTDASPAIDAGDDAVTGSPDNLATDQRGLPRLSGAHVDIGAYEVQ